MLEKIKVKDVMSTDLITITQKEDVVFAFEKLMKNKVSALPVFDHSLLMGIVTATDLGYNLVLDNYELGTTVADVMVSDVICVSPDDNLAYVVKEMFNHDHKGMINQLMVMSNNDLIGIISDGDVIRAIKKSL